MMSSGHLIHSVCHGGILLLPFLATSLKNIISFLQWSFFVAGFLQVHRKTVQVPCGIILILLLFPTPKKKEMEVNSFCWENFEWNLVDIAKSIEHDPIWGSWFRVRDHSKSTFVRRGRGVRQKRTIHTRAQSFPNEKRRGGGDQKLRGSHRVEICSWDRTV